MFKRYPQLQSGYLAPTETMVEKPAIPPSTPASALLNHPETRTQQDLFYAPAVDSFVNDVLQTPHVLKDLEWVGNMFSTVGKVFNGQSFNSFIVLQSENPHLSEIHVEFLKETIDVALGYKKNRNISLPTWASVISAANPSSIGGFKGFAFASQWKDVGFGTMTLGDFVSNWIANMGYQDFVLSMQVLFGRRSLHAIRGGTY